MHFPSCLFIFTGVLLSCSGEPHLSRKMSVSGEGFNASFSAVLCDGWWGVPRTRGEGMEHFAGSSTGAMVGKVDAAVLEVTFYSWPRMLIYSVTRLIIQ